MYKSLAGELCTVRYVYAGDRLLFEKVLPFDKSSGGEQQEICEHKHSKIKFACPVSNVVSECSTCKAVPTECLKTPREVCILLHIKNWKKTMPLVHVCYIKEENAWILLLETTEDSCDLSIYLSKNDALSLTKKKTLCRKVFNVCMELYNKYKVLHCDVKWENILIIEKDSKYEVKLIDFGNSIFVGNCPIAIRNCKRMYYKSNLDLCSPEVVQAYFDNADVNLFASELFTTALVALQIFMGNVDIRTIDPKCKRRTDTYFSEDLDTGLGSLYEDITIAHGKTGTKNCGFTCMLCHLFYGGMGATRSRGWFSFHPNHRNLLLWSLGV